MKKKETYIAPSVEVQSIECEGLIAASPGDDVVISNEGTDADAKLSRRQEIWK